MSFEVEQKFAIANPLALEQALVALGTRHDGPIVQVDTYFNHPTRDFAETDEAFRLRQVGDENCVTYKGPKLDAATKTRREIELPLGHGAEVAKQFAEMVGLLGFRRVAQVRKERRVFLVTWENRQVEVALDEVEGLGSFIELETAASEQDLESAKACIASLAKRLELSRSERRSYLELLLESDRASQ